jgi:hypothetical protein
METKQSIHSSTIEGTKTKRSIRSSTIDDLPLLDMQLLSLSAASSMDVQGASLSFHCQQYGRAGCIPFHRQ